MEWFFPLFVLSGFAGLVYQVTWLRIAMAHYGVTTSMVSIVLSVFMAGLGLGSFLAGKLARSRRDRPPRFFLGCYAAVELGTGISGLVVAPALRLGERLLLQGGLAWGSLGHYLFAGVWITLALLPFCACMGATFPLAMAGIGGLGGRRARTSFSYLYVANVLGAMAGALGSAFVLIELMGFRATMLVAVCANLLAAATASVLAATSKAGTTPASANEWLGPARPIATEEYPLLALLFVTGMVSLAMEVVWTRQYVPLTGPFVYTFAAILVTYLGFTAGGSWLYRLRLRRAGTGGVLSDLGVLAVTAAVCGLFPLAVADPLLAEGVGLREAVVRLASGIGPFCAVLGFLTSMVVDRFSAGEPRRAGTAYALNAAGCIVGPLLSGFVTLPLLGERWSLVLLTAPLAAFGLIASLPARREERGGPWLRERVILLGAGVGAVLLVVSVTQHVDAPGRGAIVLRDHTATVVASGDSRATKRLLVNGVGMTTLTPVTKMMVHLTLAHLEEAPRQGLVLCLGMGTSLRSLASWGIRSTAVELVPSVPRLLPFYHADGEQLLRSPLTRIVVDDARRFLGRSDEMFDAIVVDPPPPVEAAGSSLLYSTEFYRTAGRHLRRGGIMQQWLPNGEPVVVTAISKALTSSFPYVRVFRSLEGWGFHFLASARPIPVRTAKELAARLPAAAVKDLLEWGPEPTAEGQFRLVLTRELSIRGLEDESPETPALTDDHPVNEYFLLRRWRRSSGRLSRVHGDLVLDGDRRERRLGAAR
jgi:spermidine synthase